MGYFICSTRSMLLSGDFKIKENKKIRIKIKELRNYVNLKNEKCAYVQNEIYN